jgi:hypothetical protein
MPTFRSVSASPITLTFFVDGRKLSTLVVPRATVVIDNAVLTPESAVYVNSNQLLVTGPVPVSDGTTARNNTLRASSAELMPIIRVTPLYLPRAEYLSDRGRLLNEFKGTKANEAEMLATVLDPFDVVRRTDGAYAGLWMLIQDPPTDPANWERISGGSGGIPQTALEGLTGGGATNLDGVATTQMPLRTLKKVQLGSVADGSVYLRDAVLLANPTLLTTDVAAGRVVPLDAHPTTNNVIWILN